MRSRQVLFPVSLLVLILMLTSLALGPVPALAVTEPDLTKVDRALLERLAAEGETEFYLILVAQADLSGAAALGSKNEKTSFVLNQLQAVATWTQRPLLDYLDRQNVPYHSMYIQNMVRVQAGLPLLQALAARPEVARIVSPPDPRPEPTFFALPPAERVAAVEWNVARIHAPEAWDMGYRGEGMVVASNDTGAQYNHPALVNQYRGNLGGGSFDHNHNWWDSYAGSQVPVDYDGHGTHTIGTMVGDDGGANQIGVAPGARWIACAGLNLECLEFFLAPWDLNGQNPDPAKAPDAINNSWYDPSGFDYRPIIQALNAAGIAVIKSAGNNGPGCGTISNPGYVPEIIATAAFDQNDNIANFSSRGPMSNYGETILKPEVAAPGVSVRSSIPTDTYGFKSGTSMAAPHTTALVTLMWNAAPCLRGDVPTTKDLMMGSAEPKIDAQCPPFVDHPNDVWGWGILDAQAAVQDAIGYCGGLGTLTGTVTDEGTEDPIPDADVTAYLAEGGSWKMITGPSGTYTLSVLGGTYTVTVEAYGYEMGQATGVVVYTDTITTQDFSLTPSAHYIVSGTVTEEGTGAPLLAQVEVLGTPLDPVTTNPATGYYSVTVAEGTYTFRASADLHLPIVREDVVVDMNQTQDFVLTPLPCLLLVDDDTNSPDVRTYYTAALDALEVDYAIWDLLDQGDPTEGDLFGYQAVVWFTGYPWSNTFNSANEAAVAAYLDQGGTFFISSEDYLYDRGLTAFGNNYLGIAGYTNDVNRADPVGNPGDPVGDGLGPYTLTPPPGWGTLYTDNVNAAQSSPFRWQGTGQNNSTGYDNGTFKSVFLAWPFEGLANLSDRVSVLTAVLNWFDTCLCVPPSITGSYSDSPVELGQPLHLAVEVSGTAPFTYTWKMNGPGYGSGLDTATPILTYTLPGVYTPTVMVENACGSDEDALVVEVICDAPLATFTSNSPVTIGEPIAFTALVSGTAPFTYTWDFGGPGSGVGLATPTPVFTYTAYGPFTVVLTVANPCGTDVFSDAVVVRPQAVYLPILLKGAGG